MKLNFQHLFETIRIPAHMANSASSRHMENLENLADTENP